MKSACEDIRALNVQQMQMVPISGMTDILRVVKSANTIKKGSWVRVKKGMYRDDLAKVEDCDMAQNLVTLKLIPRIDYSKKRGFFKSQNKEQSDIVPEPHQAFQKKNRYAFKRPPAKLFDETAVEYGSHRYPSNHLAHRFFLRRAINGQIRHDLEYRVFEGQKFDQKGFLIKSFPLHTVVRITRRTIFPWILSLISFSSRPMV